MSRVKLTKTIVMVGMMGAGKTAIGSALAQMLKVPFLDSDHEIEKAADLSVGEIFTRFGEPFFRTKETQVIGRLLDGDPCVLSTGGGAFLLSENRDLINEKGLSVWLKVEPELLWTRVKHKDTRPLLRVADPKAKLFELYQERLPSYQNAGLIVEADPNFTIQQMALRVFEALEAYSEILGKGS